MVVSNDINVEDVAGIQRKLLDLAQTHTQSNVRACLVALRQLIGAEGSFAFYFQAGSPVMVSDDIGEEISDYLFSNWTGFDREGYFLFADKELESINRMRRSLGSGIHHERKIGSREMIEQTRYFKQAFEPAGMHHVIGMTARLPIGEAVFAFGFSGPEAPGFIGEHTERILGFILPVFEYAFNTIDKNSPGPEEVADKIEKLPCAAALIDETGHAIFANRKYKNMPESLSSTHQHRVLGPVLDGCRSSELVLLLSQPSHSFDMSSAARNAGLSIRQVEVVHLLTEGVSNCEIAKRLDISIHTVRSHVEKILDCLGVSSRAAVLPALMHREAFSIH
jgi:DNA-binding CsgD family transcriptional regulator